MKREALSLVVACTNSNDGCTWKGEVRYAEVTNKTTFKIIINIFIIVRTIVTGVCWFMLGMTSTLSESSS